jgi:hypothetical protein
MGRIRLSSVLGLPTIPDSYVDVRAGQAVLQNSSVAHQNADEQAGGYTRKETMNANEERPRRPTLLLEATDSMI